MHTRAIRFLGITILLAVSFVASGSVFAASTVYEWGGSTGIFSNDTLWTPGGGPPTNTDTAVFGTTGSYTVTFDRNERSDFLYVTNSNTVLFDLGGNTYTINSPAVVNRLFLGSNSTDNVTLTIENGTIDALFNPNRIRMVIGLEGGTASLILTNSGKLNVSYLNTAAGANGQVLVTGPGSYFSTDVDVWLDSATEMPVTVRDGAGWSSGDTRLKKLEVSGGSVTNSRIRHLVADGGYDRVIDGGTLVIGPGSSEMSFANAAIVGSVSLLVGDGSGPGTSRLVLLGAAGIGPNISYAAGNAANVDFTIGSDGLVQYAAPSSPIFRLNQNATLTLDNGSMELTNATRLFINTNRSTFASGVLRGRGTISVIGSGTENFSLDNYGVIRPGDLSATPAIGTLTLNNGDLYQTNSAGGLSSRMYFEFDETSNDLLQLTSGSALVTAGTNTFALAPGAGIPLPGAKYGKGIYDFLVATNLTWSPAYDNMSNLLSGTYGLAYGLDYQYGVVQIGADQFALRLAFVPEPSTIMLLLGGGLILWRFRRRPQ